MAQAYCQEAIAGHQAPAQHSEHRVCTVRVRESGREAFWHNGWTGHEKGQKYHGRQTMQSYTENNGFTDSMQRLIRAGNAHLNEQILAGGFFASTAQKRGQ